MAGPFGRFLSNGINNLQPFTFQITDDEISHFQSLLSLSKIAPATWENQQEDGRFGVTRKWLDEAKKAWLEFDWRAFEERINSFPNYKTRVEDPQCGSISIHFAAMISSREDAVPVIFMHGWPGSFLEFLPMLDRLSRNYTPKTLPYHVIVPSLPGYGFSSSPQDKELTVVHAARILNQLMINLGFGKGYIAQGGDIGSLIARNMSASFKECKAYHVNMLTLGPDDDVSLAPNLSEEEEERQKAMKKWLDADAAYSLEHGTKPSTIGLALSTSPLALLAWIGEKYIDWADSRQPLPLDTVLGLAGLYWFTSCFPSSIYPYREIISGKGFVDSKEKPFGYSAFNYDILIVPKPWVEKFYPNMVQYRYHAKGGHFAALEEPDTFLEDFEAFFAKVKDLVLD